MNRLLTLLRLDFLPRSVDLGLLILRLWLGLSMLLLHGRMKAANFSEMSQKFPDLLGIGSSANLTLALAAELIGAALLVLGLFTRVAALALATTMIFAFVMVHKMALSGPQSGELAFIYLAGFLTLVATGAGRFSLDAKMTRGSAFR